LLLTFSLPSPLYSPLFPYTTLFRSGPGTLPPNRARRPACCIELPGPGCEREAAGLPRGSGALTQLASWPVEIELPDGKILTLEEDRKSTRLNSSHDQISYAVFCMKK